MMTGLPFPALVAADADATTGGVVVAALLPLDLLFKDVDVAAPAPAPAGW